MRRSRDGDYLRRRDRESVRRPLAWACLSSTAGADLAKAVMVRCGTRDSRSVAFIGPL